MGASAFAGSTMVAASKNPVQQETMMSLYADREWNVDIFGTYAFTESTNERILGDHAFGGGVAVNYFFTRNWGIGLEGQALKTQRDRNGDNEDVVASGALNVIYRYPIGTSGWAPYVYVGGGAVFNAHSGSNSSSSSFTSVDSLEGVDGIQNIPTDATDSSSSSHNRNDENDTLFEGHAGAGVEYRITRNFGIFTDGRWTVVDGAKNNFPSVRTGVRFAF